MSQKPLRIHRYLIILLMVFIMLFSLLAATSTSASSRMEFPRSYPVLARFATFNASLNRFNAGDLVTDLSTPDNLQAQNVAEIIQRTRF